MRAEHNDLVGFGFIGAGDFADDVEGVEVVVVELVLDVHQHGDGDFLFEHANDAAVVFVSDGDTAGRRILRFVAVTALLHEYGAVIAAGRLDPSGDAFLDEELLYLELEIALGTELRDAFFDVWACAGDFGLCEVSEFGVGVAMSLGLEAFRTFGNRSGENELAFELPFELGEVFFFGDGRENGVGGDGTVSAGRPSLCISDERERVRGNDLDAGAFIGPAAAERAPRLEVDVGELPFV